jgi:hypothetical protein
MVTAASRAAAYDRHHVRRPELFFRDPAPVATVTASLRLAGSATCTGSLSVRCPSWPQPECRPTGTERRLSNLSLMHLPVAWPELPSDRAALLAAFKLGRRPEPASRACAGGRGRGDTGADPPPGPAAPGGRRGRFSPWPGAMPHRPSWNFQVKAPGPQVGVGAAGLRPQPNLKHGPVRAAGASGPLETPSLAHWQFADPDLRVAFKERFPRSPRPLQSSELETTVLW